MYSWQGGLSQIKIPAKGFRLSNPGDCKQLRSFTGIFCIYCNCVNLLYGGARMNRYVHQQRDRIVETGKRVTDLFVQKMCQKE